MIAIQAETTTIYLNGEKLDLDSAPSSNDCKCGKPSEYGCHGVKDYALYDEFLCKQCYIGRNKNVLS